MKHSHDPRTIKQGEFTLNGFTSPRDEHGHINFPEDLWDITNNLPDTNTELVVTYVLRWVDYATIDFTRAQQLANALGKVIAQDLPGGVYAFDTQTKKDLVYDGRVWGWKKKRKNPSGYTKLDDQLFRNFFGEHVNCAHCVVEPQV